MDDKVFTDLFKTRLREARQAARLTQAEVDGKADWAPTTTAQYECGSRKPSAANLAIMADVLGCSADYLLGRSNQAQGG